MIARVDDLKEDDGARNAKDMLIEMSNRGEIERAVREMKDSSLGEGGLRLRYI